MIIVPLIAALEFISLPMLGWLVAALVPWLIHRWQRRQHTTTPWAAVELLLTAMQQRTRTIHIQQWLLLVVRTAILIFVALAAAEPTFRQWAIGAGGSAQVHRILVMDQSYSMGAKQRGSTRWERALTYARKWIDDSNGDAITLIGWSAESENLTGRPTFDTAVALAALESLELSETSVELPQVARAVLAAIERAQTELPQLAAHQVLFCTDLGRNTWQSDSDDGRLIEQLSQQAQVTVVDVSGQEIANFAITDLSIEPALTLSQQEAVIAARVKQFGEGDFSALDLELLVDGRSVGQQRAEVDEQEESTVRFSHRFVESGMHTVQVKLVEADDPLLVDNSRWLIADVRPRLRVACFTGENGAAEDLARALAPGRGAESVASAIRPEIFSINRLSDTTLSDFAAVMLCSVAELSSQESAIVSEYVQQGGGLALFLDGQTNRNTFRHLQEMLPVRLQQTQPLGQYRFDVGEYEHPIVSAFRGQSQAGLLGVTVSQYVAMQMNGTAQQAEVVLAFDSGDPALVVEQLGLGRVAVSALPGSLRARTEEGTPWSNFALSPSFLPVVRELVTYLVSDRWLEQRNIAVGQPAVFAVDSTEDVAELSVQLPVEGRQRVDLSGTEERGQLTFSETSASGVYRFYADEAELARFAVNLDSGDVDLSSIGEEELPAGFALDAAIDSATLPQAIADFSLVRLLLAGAVLLLLVEIGLAYSIGRGWS